ncbi:hypothetical protein V5O48_017782 [Marasmius crinis-equi]|uniref:Integrase core domain-containing protein n=1 Tax=Marasmius crinis-equi TaxID=585013 RepID=A0ABR3EN10_9AGAR
MAQVRAEEQQILDGFQLHYRQFVDAVNAAQALDNPDAFLFQLLGDDLQAFSDLASQHADAFASDQEEFQTLQESLQRMILDLRMCLQRAVESSHRGRPQLVQQVSDGGPGRPHIEINQDWLAWAYTERSVTGIAHFLGVSRSTVRTALLNMGIARPGINPFPDDNDDDANHSSNEQSLHDPDVGLNPDPADFLHMPEVDPHLHSEESNSAGTASQSSRNLSDISETDLDRILLDLRAHFPQAGIKTLQGMMRTMGHRVHSVHNVRIERLWVDVRAQIAATWEERFTELELQLGMDVNNLNHIWLLQLLFLPILNTDIEFWREAWNSHDITIRDGPSRSPNNMFRFDMFIWGLRGDALENFPMSEEELEIFGVDWEGLHDDTLLRALRENYSSDGASSWLGPRGPPQGDLSEVEVTPPPCSLSVQEVRSLLEHISPLPKSSQRDDVHRLWSTALVFVRQLHPELF